MAFEKKIRLVAPTMTVTRKDERKSFFVFTERVATAKSPSGERIEVVRVISNPNNLLLWGEEFEGDIDLSATLQAAFANVTRENGGVIAQAEPDPRKADAIRVANALELCDWSGCPIGNKELLKAAVELLRGE